MATINDPLGESSNPSLFGNAGQTDVIFGHGGDDTINRAPIEIPSGRTAANRTDRQVLVMGVREAIGVTLDLARGKLFFTGGTGGRVGMANLDGTGAMNLLTGSAGLTGIQVVELGQ